MPVEPRMSPARNIFSLVGFGWLAVLHYSKVEYQISGGFEIPSVSDAGRKRACSFSVFLETCDVRIWVVNDQYTHRQEPKIAGGLHQVVARIIPAHCEKMMPNLLAHRLLGFLQMII